MLGTDGIDVYMFYTNSGKNTSVFYLDADNHHQLGDAILCEMHGFLVYSGARNSNNAIVSHHILKQMAPQ